MSSNRFRLTAWRHPQPGQVNTPPPSMPSRPWPAERTALRPHDLHITPTFLSDRTVVESTMSACTSVIKKRPITFPPR